MNDLVMPAKLLNSKFLITLSDRSAETSEAIRQLRTHVMARHVQQGHRALAICAASEGVGCTFVAANLAVALSQIGVNTLPDRRRYAPSNYCGGVQLSCSKMGSQEGLVFRREFQRLF